MSREAPPGSTEGPMEASSRECPLCSAATEECARVGGRPYRSCSHCLLVHVPRAHHLGPEAERARYDTHENDPGDPGYRAFLDRLAGPLSAVLHPGADGLDFGSGPGPTLSVMMRERGFSCTDYDPFYAPDEGVLGRSYDFIACTEVLEHLARPKEELERMRSLLRPGGWLGVMTELLPPGQRFEAWWYIRDPSHVCFYRAETMEWIASRFGFRMRRPGPNVRLFRTPPG